MRSHTKIALLTYPGFHINLSSFPPLPLPFFAPAPPPASAAEASIANAICRRRRRRRRRRREEKKKKERGERRVGEEHSVSYGYTPDFTPEYTLNSI